MTRRMAVITGAGSGIGAAIATTLATDHDLLLTHLTDDPGLATTITDAQRHDASVTAVIGDLTEQRVQKAFTAAVEQHADRVQVLVCNAGAYPRTPWADTTPAGLRRDIEVNLFSHLACLHAVTPAMTANQHGRIIAISSVLTQVARNDLAGYITAKGGLESLIRALARELGPHGITANTVRAGSIQVPAEHAVVADPDAMHARQLDKQCIKRRGRPADVAATVAFLASEQAGFITGQAITVDGGWHLA